MTDTGWIPGYEEAMKANRAQREDAVHKLGELLDLAVRRFVQRGKDPDTARFFIELSDGELVPVGPIRVLWSQAELSKALAVRIGRVVPPTKLGAWNHLLGAMIRYATDVEEPEDEHLLSVRAWLRGYLRSASSDRDGAIAASRPFIVDDAIHIAAESFATFIRREFSEPVKLHELRSALRDLGFERKAVNYHRGSGTLRKRSTASYYVVAVAHLDPQQDD